MSGKVRVLVVDDSALMRKLIPQALLRDPSIEVIGTAMDGLIGMRKIDELRPDVVTLDLDMPRMDGIEMLRQITHKERVPVIVFSAHTEAGASITLKALRLGAFDFVAKPQDAAAGNIEQIASELVSKIKAAVSSGPPKIMISAPASKRREGAKLLDPSKRASRIVAIGVSTGGPNALEYVFSQIPEDFRGCLLVVQHMPEGFTSMFARRLNDSSAIEVKEAQSGDLLLAGRALICPGNRHIKVRRLEHGDIAILDDQPRINGHRPSVDVLFESVAHEFSAAAVAVLMTGMGDDGAVGMGAVRSVGGLTIAQSLDTCVVESMPRAAIERGFAMRVVPLPLIASTLQTICSSVHAPSSLEMSPLTSAASTADFVSRRRSS